MATSIDLTRQNDDLDTGGIWGHPRGLTTLFFTEMWERFSFYGMRALLVLYMTTAAASGGLGFDDKMAASIYGAYTGSVYLMSIPGGWIADNVLGTRRSVLIGGIIIALGHYAMVVPSTYTFYLGLVLIVLGTGLLKPNVSAVVGSLYREDDERRDAGFSVFYMGINLGAFIAPLICSYLGEKIDWHLGFGVAGLGMTPRGDSVCCRRKAARARRPRSGARTGCLAQERAYRNTLHAPLQRGSRLSLVWSGSGATKQDGHFGDRRRPSPRLALHAVP